MHAALHERDGYNIREYVSSFVPPTISGLTALYPPECQQQ
jgi:hypothetical protein